MVPILKQSTRFKKKYVVRFFYGGKQRRHKQIFGKIATIVAVLNRDENFL